MLRILIFICILTVSFFIGTFGFAQIVGSLQRIRTRAPHLTAFTIILWLLILGGAAALVICLLPEYPVALYIGYGVSLLLVLRSGRIE